MKICHNCIWSKFKLPLFLFRKSNLKYQLKSDQGRTRTCRICNAKRAWNSTVVRRVDGKFTVLTLNKTQIFKEFFTI